MCVADNNWKISQIRRRKGTVATGATDMTWIFNNIIILFYIIQTFTTRIIMTVCIIIICYQISNRDNIIVWIFVKHVILLYCIAYITLRSVCVFLIVISMREPIIITAHKMYNLYVQVIRVDLFQTDVI